MTIDIPIWLIATFKLTIVLVLIYLASIGVVLSWTILSLKE